MFFSQPTDTVCSLDRTRQTAAGFRSPHGWRLVLILCVCLSTSACVSTVVGAVVDTAIEVAKVPFKVAGAVIDVASGGDDSDDDESNKLSGTNKSSRNRSDQTAEGDLL